MAVRGWLNRLRVLLAPFTLFGATGAHAQPVAESLGDGLARFWADSSGPLSTMPRCPSILGSLGMGWPPVSTNNRGRLEETKGS